MYVKELVVLDKHYLLVSIILYFSISVYTSKVGSLNFIDVSLHLFIVM